MIPIMERMTARTTAADAIITSTFQRTVEFMMTLILLQKKCAVTVEEETPLVRFQIYEFRVKLALKSLKIKNYQRLFSFVTLQLHHQQHNQQHYQQHHQQNLHPQEELVRQFTKH